MRNTIALRNGDKHAKSQWVKASDGYLYQVPASLTKAEAKAEAEALAKHVAAKPGSIPDIG